MVPLMLAVLPFLVEVCYVFVTGVWEAGLLVAGDLVGYIGLVRVMKLMCIVLSTLLTLHLLQSSFFVDGLNLSLMCLRASGRMGLLWDAVCRHGPCGPICSLHPWDEWVPSDLHGFHKWGFDSLDTLNDFTRHVVVSRREAGVRKWTRWLWEDLGSRPFAWLRLDCVLRLPFL